LTISFWVYKSEFIFLTRPRISLLPKEGLKEIANFYKPQAANPRPNCNLEVTAVSQGSPYGSLKCLPPIAKSLFLWYDTKISYSHI
jgi:hypothetical protein